MAEERIWQLVNSDWTTSRETETSLRQRIAEGSVRRETLIRRPGMAEWEPAGRVQGLFAAPPSASDEDPNPSQPQDLPPIPARKEPDAGNGGEPRGNSRRQSSSMPKPRPNGVRRCYISRHWHGESSLGISYWINGLLLSLIAAAGAAVLGALDITLAPRLIAAAYVAFTTFLVALGTWQLVGIWRSAGRRIRERKECGKGAAWAYLARVATALGFLFLVMNTLAYRAPSAWAYVKIAFGDGPIPHHILRVLNGGLEIELAGGIDFGTSADLRTLLDATPQVRTIDFNSLGGRIAEALHVRDLIRERHLATYTDAWCASACTVAYMGGYPRYLGPGGKLGFHRYTFPGLTPEQDAAVNIQGEQELINAGVSRVFAAKVFTTASTDLWVPDRSTLLAAHVVTQVVDGMTFAAAAAVGEPVTVASAERTLDAIPGFAALRRADPTAFSHAVADLVVGLRQGETMRDVIAQATMPVLAAVAKFRLVAGDRIQVQIAALLAAEARSLAGDHPDACLALLNESPQNEPSYSQFLPPTLAMRDAALTATIIGGGFADPSYLVDPEEVAAAEIKRLWLQVSAKGVDVSPAGRTPATEKDKRATCIALAEFFAAVSALPASRAGALMRYLEGHG